MNKTYLKNTLALLCLSSSVALFSQQNVSINLSGALSANPAILDLSDVSNAHLGFLMPNVNLSSITDIVTIPGPTVGTIIWNTNAALSLGIGYYYWSGTQWNYLYNSGTPIVGGVTSIAPGASGANSGGGLTFAPNPIIGVGTIAIANTTVTAGSYGDATDVATFTVNGQGQLTAAANVAISASGIGAITGSGTLNYLARWTPSGTVLGIGVSQDNGATVGINAAPVATNMLTVTETSAANIAILGQNTAGNGTNNGTGVEGTTSQGYNSTSGNNGYGLEGLNNNAAAGTGVYGAGNALGIYNFLLAGSGGSFNGTLTGCFATNSTYNTTTGGSAYVGDNEAYGGNQVDVACYTGTFYKTIATAAAVNSCAIPDLNGNYVCMHSAETPEAYFEDYGEGQLTNGKVHIDIDPIFAKNVTINAKHPLRVYVQLEGNCKGVYVTNKTTTGFDVVELDGGMSNVSFQYHVICNMADATLSNGVTSKFADLRFEPAPKIQPHKASSGMQSQLSK